MELGAAERQDVTPSDEDRTAANGEASPVHAGKGLPPATVKRGLLPRSGPVRGLLKRLYYSWAIRNLLYGPLDAIARLRGPSKSLVPPRRLQYIGQGDFAEIGQRWRRLLIHDHGLSPDDDVLDIGCGVGRIALALAPYLEGGRYEGFDVVPSGIEWCRREITSRHPSFRFQLADVYNRQYNPSSSRAAVDYCFPYEDESFDLAVAASVFTHVRPDGIRRYVGEAARVLRPGGRLVCEFFLVDGEAERLLAEGRSQFALDHEFVDESGTRFVGSDVRVPEFNVGIRVADLEEITRSAGLILAPMAFGKWSGRRHGRGARFQDLVTLVKPARPAS